MAAALWRVRPAVTGIPEHHRLELGSLTNDGSIRPALS